MDTETQEAKMARRWTNDLTRDDVTPRSVWLNRRQIIAGAAGLGGLVAAGAAHAQDDLELTSFEDISSYNNF